MVFTIKPYKENIAKSILKAPKVYFYDTGRVRGDIGSKVENLVAFHLLKRNHFLEDTTGDKYELYFVKDSRGREVDFLTTKDYKPEYLLEVKTKDEKLSRPLKHFTEIVQPEESLQIVYSHKDDKQFDSIKIKSIRDFLFSLDI